MNKFVMAFSGLLLGANSACAADGGARDLFRRIDTNGDLARKCGEVRTLT